MTETEHEGVVALGVEGKGPCCNEWAEATVIYQAPVGGGWLYPQEMMPDAQIEQDDTGEWNINGCCGGGCYVVTHVRFCPFCGSSVISKPIPPHPQDILYDMQTDGMERET